MDSNLKKRERTMKRISRSLIRLLLALGLGTLVCSPGYSYVDPDPIELTKQFNALEALARDGSPAARQELVKAAISAGEMTEAERIRVRRMAFRMLSRVGQRADFSAIPALDSSDWLWSCWRLADMRISARERGESKSTTAQTLLNFLSGLSEVPAAETTAARIVRQGHAGLAEVEVRFYLADQGLPSDGFPAEIVERSSEIALARLRAQYGQIAESGLLVETLREQLRAENPWLRDAAAALVIERGESALPAVISLLRENIPTSNPPPWTSQIHTLRSCVDILKGIGGETAAATLTELKDNPVPYVAECGSESLTWVESGVGYQPLYQELISYPPFPPEPPGSVNLLVAW
jgi:hypothetical protein